MPLWLTTRAIVRIGGVLSALAACVLAGLVGVAPARAEDLRGLPFVRPYSLHEIGRIPRGARIGFDSYGRFAVMYDGIYAVLNDTAWVDRIDASPANRTLMTLIRVVNGTYYYGGRASWGIVEQTRQGTLRARSLVPADAPAWTTVTPFNEMVAVRTGVCFFELNGVVYWDFAKQKNFFFELPRVATCFRVGDRVFVSCQDRVMREISPAGGSIQTVAIPGLEGAIIERAAPLDEARTLLSLQDGRLLVFDGTAATPWAPQGRFELNGRILALTPLAEGGVGLSIVGKGLFLISAEGALRWRLPLSEFQTVGTLAANEPGVLWAMGENAIYKIFYDSPLTSFGQSLGLNVFWPRIVPWNDRLVVSSGRTLHQSEVAAPGAPSRFKPLPGFPETRVASLASQGPHLLVADVEGVFVARADGVFERIAQVQNVARLEFIAPDVCVVIGSLEIAALRYSDGRWTECAPRIAGVGDAPVHTTVRDAVWIEMGGDNVGRLTLKDGRLNLERMALPWIGGQWTNVGAVGSIVVFSGSTGNRAFYDETRGELCDAPALAALLRRSPYWVSRVTEDETGVLWATHPRGVVTFTPEDGDYRVDATSFELRNDSYPVVTVLPGNSIWISSGRSLHHVEPRPAGPPRRQRITLVSMTADQQAHELLGPTGRRENGLKISYEDNSLSFRFFSGSYAWQSPPLYQYRLGVAETWMPVDASMVLHFPKLRDGAYRLEVREAGPNGAATEPFILTFTVAPPWYGTPVSYAVYAGVLLLLLIGIARWINHRSLERNTVLERLVHERTKELEITMEKLNEETRNAATLAERSRLAGEIHDSLQQGLSGSILHLDTTMNHPSVSREVHAQLSVMRNMLSYSREEVQQAVWNLESPLLQNSTLNEALNKLAGYIHAGSIEIRVVTHAEQASLATLVQHNLLRIAQEAITNAVKHAEATLIEVTLRSHAGAVILSITDDGKGFNPEDHYKTEGHFGLRGLCVRAKSMGVDLELVSAPGAGTTVRVTVPAVTTSDHGLLR